MLSPQLSLIMQLTDIQRFINRKMDLCLGIHGISYTEFQLLHHLSLAPDQMMRRIDLAESVSLTASGITRLLKPMEKIHLVQRVANARDARVSLVQLTDAGKEVYRHGAQTAEQLSETLMKSLSDLQMAQVKEYISLINK